MRTITEYSLIPALKKDNIDQPVTALYKQYYEPVTFWLRGQGVAEEDAADLFQEAVLVLIDQVRRDKFREDSSIKTYLTGIARNLWLNEMRTRSRRINRETDFSVRENETATEDAVSRLYNRENRQQLAALFEQIGDVCKQILTGFYYQNLSMKEMLALFNYNNEQVLRNKKSKCMKHLKELITSNKELTETFKTFLAYDQ